MMSTDPHKTGQAAGDAPRHADVSFEERDVNVGAMYGYFVVLTLAVIATFVACVFILRVTTNFAEESYAPAPPSREAHKKELPPEPMLQGVPGHETDAQADLREKIRDDAKANEKLEWIDKSSGIAQIPVTDAMEIIVEQGFPAIAAPPGEKKK
jgi:hypothetical protein